LQANAKQEYELNIMAARPQPGFYTLNMVVRPFSADYLDVESFDLQVKVISQLTAQDVIVKVVDSADIKRASQEEKLSTFGGKWASLEVSRADCCT
jgi:Oligosaccharyltransferase subunit Ribophorin II